MIAMIFKANFWLSIFNICTITVIFISATLQCWYFNTDIQPNTHQYSTSLSLCFSPGSDLSSALQNLLVELKVRIHKHCTHIWSHGVDYLIEEKGVVNSKK